MRYMHCTSCAATIESCLCDHEASPPNALLPTEEVKHAINEATNGILAPRELHDAAIAAMRALAKPDELKD